MSGPTVRVRLDDKGRYQCSHCAQPMAEYRPHVWTCPDDVKLMEEIERDLGESFWRCPGIPGDMS